VNWAFAERVTRIELALSAWEVERLRLPEALTWRLPGSRVTVVDPLLPRLMTLIDPLLGVLVSVRMLVQGW
jgi:hypothetical protein